MIKFKNISSFIVRKYRTLYALVIVLIVASQLFLQFHPLHERAFASSLMYFAEVDYIETYSRIKISIHVLTHIMFF